MTMAKSKEGWERLVVNLRPDMFRRLVEAAHENHRTVSGEVRYRLELSFREGSQEVPIDKQIR